MKKVFLGIGTNLGDREANLKVAVGKIEENIGLIINSSSVFESEPWGFTTENQFLNMVAEVETKLTPAGVLLSILMIESQLGRIRSDTRYSSRVIDIDILLYDDLIIKKKNLKIPHPLMPERKFVLIPLCEIAPNLIHPVLKKSFDTLLGLCEDKSKVTRFLQSDQSRPLSAKL